MSFETRAVSPSLSAPFDLFDHKTSSSELETNDAALKTFQENIKVSAKEKEIASINSIVSGVPDCLKKVVLIIRTVVELVGLFFGSKKPLLAGFELSSWWRIVAKEAPSQIFYKREAGEGQLFLGAIPNKNSPQSREFVEKYEEATLSVLSIVEDWELRPRGDNIPFNWQELGIKHMHISSKDHIPLSNENLLKSAIWIAAELFAGRDVLTHCRAGKGRSAMAEAAFLILFKGMTTEGATDLIKRGRSVSMLKNKQRELKDFERVATELRKIPDFKNVLLALNEPSTFEAWIAINVHLLISKK